MPAAFLLRLPLRQFTAITLSFREHFTRLLLEVGFQHVYINGVLDMTRSEFFCCAHVKSHYRCVGNYLLVCVCRYALEALVLRLAREDGAEHSKYAHDFYCFHYYNMWLILNKIMPSRLVYVVHVVCSP